MKEREEIYLPDATSLMVWHKKTHRELVDAVRVEGRWKSNSEMVRELVERWAEDHAPHLYHAWKQRMEVVEKARKLGADYRQWNRSKKYSAVGETPTRETHPTNCNDLPTFEGGKETK